MRIVIDARMYGLEHAGIGRYIANLIGEIANCELRIANCEFVLLVKRKNHEELKKKYDDIFRFVECDVPHYSLAEQVFLPFYLWRLKPDLVHFPHFNVPIFWFGKYVVTIHDLIKHYSLGPATTTRTPFLYWLKYLAYRLIVYLAVGRSAAVITPSNWWKRELIKRYGLPEKKIFVTYEGISEKFANTSLFGVKPPKGFHPFPKPYIIYTGSLYPHKNVGRLVTAIKHLNDIHQLSLQLVIVCARNVFYHRLKELVSQEKAENFVNFVGFVADEELAVLYRQAEAFVFPSLLEGFGLPGLEAMATGLPVISSNATCLPEIYGKAALYFDPYDVVDLESKILTVIKDGNLRAKLRERGLTQAKKYSWQKMAKETLRVYNIL